MKNFIKAAKNGGNELKEQFKKQLKKIIIKAGIIIIIVLAIAASFFGILNTIKDAMISLYTTTSSIISEAWKWLTDDYWINLEGEIEIDDETGQSYTIVDKYIKELGSKGISLKALRLLGDADYSNEENLLENKDNKELVEKYIAEFIRADIITQQPHRRRGSELVNPNNQNKIDGGIYIYRTKEEPRINENFIVDGELIKENVEVLEKNYTQMEFIDYSEFMEKLNKNDESLRYKYTIDEETGELIVVKITKVVKTEEEIEVGKGWFYNLFAWIDAKAGTTTKYELEEQRISYKEYIAKYTMPYEFLINLCEITQNPEFVYHVALLARDTKIILAIQDDTTVEVETTEREEEHTTFTNRSGPDIAGASESEPKVTRKRTVIETTVQTPVLRVEYADTWSFYEEFEYTKNVKSTKEESEPIVNIYDKNHYSHYMLGGPYTGKEWVKLETDKGDGDYARVEVEYTYYQSTLLTKSTTVTQMITMDTTYNEAILKNSVEKSKQFLGLLRNTTGECDYDCFQADTWQRQNPLALQCAQNAEFDRQGINVQYRIPNMTRTEAPLNKLISGLDMLYAILQSNSSGYKEEDKLLDESKIGQKYEEEEKYIADEDYESAYVVKMQGLVEHLQYLMTFPENEIYTIKDLILENLFGEDDDYEENVFPGYNFWWPIDDSASNITSRVTSKFGNRNGKDHNGIDIGGTVVNEDGSTKNLEGEKIIIASADGVVTKSYFSTSYGYVIYIDHGNGFETRYAHNNENFVSVNETVRRGQIIASVGNTGNSRGAHLHFEIRLNGVPQDPLNYVSETNKQPLEGPKVTVSELEKMDLIYAIVASECATSYEGALAVISCVLNRCNSSSWSYIGTDPYSQITAPNQFSYGIEEYKDAHKKYLSGNAPNYVKQAVDHALEGKINHNYTSFRTDSEQVRQAHPNGEEIGGNWYFS